MRFILWTIVLLVAAFVGVAFYRHWVVVSGTNEASNGTQHVGVQVEVNKDKAREDVAAVRERASELAKKTSEQASKIEKGVAGAFATHTLKGTLNEVNTSRNELTVTSEKDQKHVFQLGDGCKITNAQGANLALAELKSGDHVTVTYHEKDGVKTATRIEMK